MFVYRQICLTTYFYVFNYLAISPWIVIKYKDIIFEEYSKENFKESYYYLINVLTFMLQ